jgi:hypothetical protein
MTKAQKIIILAAATLIIYLIIFPPTHTDYFMGYVEHFVHGKIPWEYVIKIAVIAGAAFLIAGIRRPGRKE